MFRCSDCHRTLDNAIIHGAEISERTLEGVDFKVWIEDGHWVATLVVQSQAEYLDNNGGLATWYDRVARYAQNDCREGTCPLCGGRVLIHPEWAPGPEVAIEVPLTGVSDILNQMGRVPDMESPVSDLLNQMGQVPDMEGGPQDEFRGQIERAYQMVLIRQAARQLEAMTRPPRRPPGGGPVMVVRPVGAPPRRRHG